MPLVDEVVDFVLGTPLLVPEPGFARSPDIHALFDFSQARRWSLAQYPEAITGEEVEETDNEEEDEDDWYGWEDIRSLEMRAVHSAAYGHPDHQGVQRLLDRVGDAIHDHLTATLPPEILQSAINEFHGDFYCILRARAFLGTNNVFFERLFSIYRRGGWPCGWDGIYPEGRFVVYLRGTPAN